MKLIYSREGGLFPQVAQMEIAIADLPDDLQKLAEDTLAHPERYKVASLLSANHLIRDGYQYRLDLQQGRKKVGLTFDDLSLPKDLQPLIHFLQQRTGKP